MHAPLLYESIVVLMFMRLPLPTGLFDSSTRFGACLTLVAWVSFFVFILYILFLLRAGHCLSVGFLFFNSVHVLFFNLVHVSFHPLFVGWLVLLPRHCIAFAMISFNLVYYTTSGLAS